MAQFAGVLVGQQSALATVHGAELSLKDGYVDVLARRIGAIRGERTGQNGAHCGYGRDRSGLVESDVAAEA